MHEWRSDIAQLACSLFLLLEGPGPWSVDAALSSPAEPAPLQPTRLPERGQGFSSDRPRAATR
jgi:hypothetical protein